MKYAVIGSGITGLGAAWLLNHNNLDITIFEADNRIGGHANTVQVNDAVSVDTGFIVFNEWTYPNMMELFDRLNVPFIKSDMGFAISVDQGRLEYSSDAIFAQRKNMFKPSFYKMLVDLVRFYRSVPKDIHKMDDEQTLGEYLKTNHYSEIFINDHLIPMGAAIWSMSADDMVAFPMKSFARFCINHGLLNLFKRPQWYTVDGGSRTYVDIISKEFQKKIRLNTPVTSIKRDKGYVYVNGEQFDKAIICTHSDQALAMLDDATDGEKEILGSIPYSTNTAILHRDKSQMPKNSKAWAAWNYLSNPKSLPPLRKQGSVTDNPQEIPASAGTTTEGNDLTLTYWMNKLQSFLPAHDDLFVTLNPKTPIDPDLIVKEQTYHHPVYSLEAIKAQSRVKEIQGKLNTWYAGAWCGYGFHEDGLSAGLAVSEIAARIKRPWQIKEKSSAIENVI